MIIFDVLARDSPQGEPGDRLRRFLTDEGYRDAQASEERGEIKIRTHAAIIEGHILVDRKSNFDRLLGMDEEREEPNATKEKGAEQR